MKLARAEYADRTLIGQVDGNAFLPFVDPSHEPLRCMRKYIESVLAENHAPLGRPIPTSEVRWLHPIRRPEKIFCIGLNYSDHAAETGAQVGEFPVVFSKFSSALIGHREPIGLPELSSQVDLEAELVVVIGQGGRNIPREVAREHVFAFACGNDVSARDWQKGRPGGQWLLGKTIDTFAPLGPFLVTADEISWPVELDIQSRLNGHVMQQANTRNFIFPIEDLIAHLSRFCTLRPGDLIFTGTPAGVGAARVPPVFLKPGDVVEVEIERIGRLINPVVAS
jgi:2-keto-4-pentenoate hydratase/2-oxohepta-3-ene-1,7-dioic acid hydratase in catechol pathway